MAYFPIIGLEIHVELRTKSKMFCSCPADHFGKVPNTQTCPVCLGLPGALPVPNKKAIEWTFMIGQALQCTLREESKFDRKHYFYPDLPKGYQISQYDEPFCTGGLVKTSFGDIRITRVHLEEDTGKLQHADLNGDKQTLVDFNRSGVALVEIVTEPDIVSAKQAKEYAQKLQAVIRFLGVSDADMEKGSMRLEANISLARASNLASSNRKLPNYKVEVKNLNSFRFLEKAIEFEIERQTEILELGETPQQETRGYSETKGKTFSQRSKETSEDYRYFPDPDIPPIVLTPTEIETIVAAMPKLPDDYYQSFTATHHIRADYAAQLSQEPELARFFDSLISKTTLPPQTIASYLINKKVKPDQTSVDAVIAFLSKAAQKPSAAPEDVERWVSESVVANPDLVEKFKAGKSTVIGAFMGDIMKQSRGQADPKLVMPLLQKMLR